MGVYHFFHWLCCYQENGFCYVPEPVQPSWNEVNKAQQEKEEMIYEAQKQYNKVIPQAKGQAEKTIKAKAYILAAFEPSALLTKKNPKIIDAKIPMAAPINRKITYLGPCSSAPIGLKK